MSRTSAALGVAVGGLVMALFNACSSTAVDAAPDGGPGTTDATTTDAPAIDATTPPETDAAPNTDAAGDASNDAAGDAGNDAAPLPCTGQCAPALPAGWTFAAVTTGAGPAPACAAGNPSFDAYAGINAADATCSSCAVGAPATPGSCTATLTGYSMPNCTGTASASPLFAAPACNNTAPFASFRQTSNLTPGTCPAPPAQVPVVDPVTWQTHARGCARPAAEGVCAGAGVCLATSAAPFSTKACVFQAGDVACPADFPDKQTFFRGADDTRACTACGVSYAGSCNVRLRGGPYPSCGGADIGAPGGCAVAGPPIQLAGVIESCVVSGGAPSGAAVPNDPLTVCCTP